MTRMPRAAKDEPKPESLLDFMVRLSPQKLPPYHLNPLPQLLQECPRKGYRVLASPAVRHGKTTLIMHAVAYWWTQDPTLDIFYLTYAARFSERNGREMRQLVTLAGVPHKERDHWTVSEFRNSAGGTVYVGSTDQEHQGRGADVVIVDDGLSWIDRDDAAKRDQVDDAISYMTTRLHPGGSVVIVGSRSHPDDPIGRRIEGRARAWTHVSAPAIIDEGLVTERALWPEVRSIAELRQIRAELTERGDQRVWEAQYQGRPRASVDEFFRDPVRYDSLPAHGGFRVVYGVDFAYSPTRRSDWFALVVMRVYGGTAYVLEVVRMRADLPTLLAALRHATATHGRGPIYSYVSGPEWGAIQFAMASGIHIQGMPARYDKRTRAEKTRERWNAGRVMVPQKAPWLDGFLQRVAAFTGNPQDSGDDEIDALVSGCDGALYSSVTAPRALGQRRV